MPYVVTIILIGFSALFSGLTLGLMSLGPHELKRKSSLGDERAEKIYPIRKRGNLLLVTLLIGNVAVNSTLAIFLGTIAPGVIAGLAATGLITIFGEIAPQAIFSRFALELGAKTVWLVRIIMFVLYPISKPLAWVLDKALGEELPTIYSKKELISILEEHSDSELSDVKSDEEEIARGALTFGEKKIKDVMTPRSMVVGIEEKEILNEETLKGLTKTGYSRFVVYKENLDQVIGVLYSYDLLKPESLGKKAGGVCDRRNYFVNEEENLDHALKAFLKTRHHLFMVANKFAEITGILSIEDVIEEIIGKEIVDEFDQYDNVREVAERFAKRIKNPNLKNLVSD